MSHGQIGWYELMSRDPAASNKFYTEVFDWTTEKSPMEGTDYTMWKAGETYVGGLVPLEQGEGPPSHWVAYVDVDDADAAAAEATARGGNVIVPPMDVPDIGRFCIVADPDGAVIAPMSFTTAPAEQKWPPQPGTFVWNELYSPDPDRSTAFYKALFGWSVKASPNATAGDYWEFQRGETSEAGMMRPPGPDVPPHWLPYVAVADVDAAAERVAAAGGRQLTDAMDMESMGRFQIFMDPTGAVFAVYSAAADAS